MNDILKQYLMNKYGNENPEQKLQSDYEEQKVNPWLAFASGVGQSMQGKAPDLTWVDKQNKQAYENTVGKLEQDKKDAVIDFQANQDFKKSKQEDDLNSKLNDLNSVETKSYQTLASKMMPNQDFSKMSGQQIKTQLPTLEKLYKIDSDKQDRAIALKEKNEARALKSHELNSTRSKQLGVYNNGLRAEEQYLKATNNANEYDPTGSGQWIDNSSWAPNLIKNDKAIEAQAAQDAWIESFLRDASGAAIGKNEREDYKKIYFPQPGDTTDVVANKKALRNQKMESAAQGAGLSDVKISQNENTKFPKQVRKGNQVTTVMNEQELKEAMEEGWN